jgi:predicted nuclease of predicted toxin-antitoxin system
VIRLLLDQGLPRTTGRLLSAAAWDVVHVSEIGLSRATDRQILDRAISENRVCVTLDADFHALLATADATGPSVIRIRRERLQARAMADLLRTVWPHIEKSTIDGAIITITEKSIRVRGLPVSGKANDPL